MKKTSLIFTGILVALTLAIVGCKDKKSDQPPAPGDTTGKPTEPTGTQPGDTAGTPPAGDTAGTPPAGDTAGTPPADDKAGGAGEEKKDEAGGAGEKKDEAAGGGEKKDEK
jgi:hypothetical protein